MPKFADSTPDRRQTPRTKLSEVAYIGMGPENGGLVLDVSDGGLSFHAVAPVEPAATVRFLLSLRGHSRIEGAGEVVWTNRMRTVCGLKFTSLSTGAREHLNNWAGQSQVRIAPDQKQVSPPLPPPSQVNEPSVATPSQFGAGAESVFAIPPSQDVYLSEPMSSSTQREPLFFWVAYGLLAAALIMTAFEYGVHVGKSETSFQARPAADADTQSEPSAVAPAPNPASPGAMEATNLPAGAPSAPTGASADQSRASSRQNVPTTVPDSTLVNASKADEATTSKLRRPRADGRGPGGVDQHAQEEGKSELAAGLAYLNGGSGQRNTSRAVQQLWEAVGDGNSEAELILASLYISGDVVAKSCEQARVLLMAAAKNGNVTAKVKLADLITEGCK